MTISMMAAIYINMEGILLLLLLIPLIFMQKVMSNPEAALLGDLVAAHVVPIEVLRLVQRVVMDMVHWLLNDGLHFEDQIACLDRDVLGVELARVRIESTSGLVPS